MSGIQLTENLIKTLDGGDEDGANQAFIPAPGGFQGPRDGYIFQNGEKGVQAKEVQLLIKCREENVNKVIGKITDCHSYDVPEIIYFPVSANNKFHNWINSI